MTPHHTLGHSGRSARVQHVHVISGATREITIGRCGGQSGFVICAKHNDIAKVRQGITHIVDCTQILRVGNDRNAIGIVIEITKFCSYVAVVDVDRDSTDLGACVKGFNPLMSVLCVNTDVLSTFDTNRQQVVSQARNAFI